MSWSVTDPESPVVDPVGCGPTALGDGAGAITCTATSAGGTTSVGVTVKRDSSPPAAPLIGGIAPKSYLPSALPSAGAITCVSADPTSGVAGCAVTGYSPAAGPHVLTATATNGAGLAATSTLAYTVARARRDLAARARARASRWARLAKTGFPLTVSVATGSTKLVARLTARLPAAQGKPARTIALGTLTRRVPAGTAHLRIRLTPEAARRLQGHREGDAEGRGHRQLRRGGAEAPDRVGRHPPLGGSRPLEWGAGRSRKPVAYWRPKSATGHAAADDTRPGGAH